MKKSFRLSLAFCGVIVLLFTPGIVAADTFVLPSNPNSLGSYRDFGDLTGYYATLPCVNLTNAVLNPDPAQINYTPDPGQPGYVPGFQYTYVINLPSPTGGRLPDVPGLSPVQMGVSGLLVLSDVTNLQLPKNLQGWEDPKFLSQVVAIVGFLPGLSTVICFESPHQQVPEPGVLLLLGCGLVALAGMRRVIKK